MRYRRLGRTNLNVSEISYGAARGYDDPATFTDAVRAALDAGINLIDTAASYGEGESERALGAALRPDDDVIVQTKYLPYESHAPEAAYTGSPERLRESVEASLHRLGREHVDILLGHGMRTVASFDRFMDDGCYEAMTRLRDEGKVRFIGISELSEADGEHAVLQRAVPTEAFDVVMLTINILLQSAIDDVLPLCTRHDVGTVVMMPLNQASRDSGLVSAAAARECVRRHVAAGHLPNAPPYTDADLFDFLDPLPIPEAALRLVLAQDVSTCCVGARTRSRVLANLRAIDPPYLDAPTLARLRELFGSIREQVR